MEQQFKCPSSANPTPIENLVRLTLEKHNIQACQNTIFFTPSEIQNKSANLPNRKAPGPDGITNSALKHCGNNKVTIQLTHIYNGCIRNSYFPKSWKNAIMIMIPKPGKNVKLPVNHRPISLLNTMAKVFESLLLDKLTIHTKTRPEQFGFRSNHGTTSQLVKVISDITNNYNRREKTVVALFDIEKAFDKVWHDGHIYKLIKSKIPYQLTNIIKSFLSNRTFQIRIGDKMSTPRKINAGVPQGSCLAPQLFSIFINDLPQHPKLLYLLTTLWFMHSVAQISTRLNICNSK